MRYELKAIGWPVTIRSVRTSALYVTAQASNMYDNADAAARVEADERFRAIAHNAVATLDPIMTRPTVRCPRRTT